MDANLGHKFIAAANKHGFVGEAWTEKVTKTVLFSCAESLAREHGFVTVPEGRLAAALDEEHARLVGGAFPRDRLDGAIAVLRDTFEACGISVVADAVYAAQVREPTALQFDGLYSATDATSTSFLRFYEDGTVISQSTESGAHPLAVARWFSRERDGVSRGRYAIDGASIGFSTTSSVGTVDYAGEISPAGLVLSIRSQINGHRGTLRYKFISIDFSAAAARAAQASEEERRRDERLCVSCGGQLGWWRRNVSGASKCASCS